MRWVEMRYEFYCKHRIKKWRQIHWSTHTHRKTEYSENVIYAVRMPLNSFLLKNWNFALFLATLVWKKTHLYFQVKVIRVNRGMNSTNFQSWISVFIANIWSLIKIILFFIFRSKFDVHPHSCSFLLIFYLISWDRILQFRYEIHWNWTAVLVKFNQIMQMKI